MSKNSSPLLPLKKDNMPSVTPVRLTNNPPTLLALILFILLLLPPPALSLYSLTVRSSMMIAHSFANSTSFGPAQNLHGATYTVDVTFKNPRLHPRNNWVVDIGAAGAALEDVLEEYNLKNLDDLFPRGTLTTTEFMAKQVHEKIKEKKLCPGGTICVTLKESHKAWGSYEGKA